MTLRKAMGLWATMLVVQATLVVSVHASGNYSSEAVATFDMFAAVSVVIVLASATLCVVWARQEAKRAGRSTCAESREGKAP